MPNCREKLNYNALQSFRQQHPKMLNYYHDQITMAMLGDIVKVGHHAVIMLQEGFRNVVATKPCSNCSGNVVKMGQTFKVI